MPRRDKFAVCSAIHTKYTHCRHNVEFCEVESGGRYSNSWAVGG